VGAAGARELVGLDEARVTDPACFCGRDRAAGSRPRWSDAVAARGGEWASKVRTCDDCGLVFLDARGLAPSGGHPLAGPADKLMTKLHRERVEKIAKLAPRGGRALDVGAGVGKMVAELVRAGLDAYGVEPDAERAAEGGARVAKGTLANAPDGEPFDLVIFWHTLEHHDRPFEALVRAAVLTRPGGALVIAVPNAGSWQAAIAGPKWLHLDLPHHRAHFTAATLRALAADAGFDVELVRTGQVEMDVAGMVDALGAAVGLPAQFAFDALRRGKDGEPFWTGRRVAGLAFTAVALPLSAVLCGVARLCGRAGTLILVARRRAETGALRADDADITGGAAR